jgi:hypothetical protein
VRAISAALLLLGCAPHREPVATVADTPLTRLSATIEQQCSDCHGAGIGPDLSGLGRGEHDLLWRAAEQVASSEMPPNAKLTTQERSVIVRQLCDALEADAALCSRTMLLDDVPSMVRSPSVVQRELETTWNVSPTTHKLLDGLSNAKVKSYTYDNVDLNTTLSLSAIEGCSVMADGTTPRPADEIDRCVRAFVDRDLLRPLPVPEETK